VSLAPLVVAAAGGFALAGVVVAFRTWRRRRNIERRRLESLGIVESHREVRPRDGN
jgi:hypothetical protein